MDRADAAQPVRTRIHRQTRLGEMIRLYRAIGQWSLRDMATEIGIGHATLLRIETGQNIDADTLVKLVTWMLAEHRQPPGNLER